MKNPTLPILYLSGEKDPCIGGRRAFHEAMAFMKSRGYQNVKGHLYPGLRHEILNEDNKEAIYHDILSWLEHEVNASSPTMADSQREAFEKDSFRRN